MEAKALVLPQWGDGTDLVDDPGVTLLFMKGNWGGRSRRTRRRGN